MNIFWRWIKIFGLLNLLDYISTMMGISMGAVEINSFANYFIQKDSLFHFKVVGFVLLAVFLYKIAKRSLTDCEKTTRLLKYGSLVYTLIVLNNFMVYYIQFLAQ
ncbi:hypothetical protein CACET_c29140 [Clostridium aceticum]|uniref:DUF5658 domain-containing protein n=1 Tax=Clostridium aceticum TaxID=84022 RepID=A0A0D8ICM5_9CLOT|nr:DUF5658 family protein [Clostridium aceticum]AKL96358.1 hypothetical protein CACET_c29140 [Clostridium aceticum]KJF26946.1 hypothetical protein TZ02_10450 [Clostridium aceticum]